MKKLYKLISISIILLFFGCSTLEDIRIRNPFYEKNELNYLNEMHKSLQKELRKKQIKCVVKINDFAIMFGYKNPYECKRLADMLLDFKHYIEKNKKCNNRIVNNDNF